VTSKLYNRYHDGALVRLTASFTNIQGDYQDPTTITVRVKNPSTGAVVTYTYAGGQVVKDDVGIYHRDVDTTDYPEGTWFYKWIGTGAVVAADQWAFVINHEEAS